MDEEKHLIVDFEEFKESPFIISNVQDHKVQLFQNLLLLLSSMKATKLRLRTCYHNAQKSYLGSDLSGTSTTAPLPYNVMCR